MIGPQTLADARKYRYGKWAGNPKGNAFREGDCACEVFPPRGIHYQCTKRATQGLFCGTHARVIRARAAAALARLDEVGK